MSDTWKGAYIARTDFVAGGCWHRSRISKADALRGLRQRLKADWSRLYDIDAALNAGIRVKLYRDAGTENFDDDEFLETAILYG